MRDIAAFLASGSGVSIDFVLDVWGISSPVSFLSSMGDVVFSGLGFYASWLSFFADGICRIVLDFAEYVSLWCAASLVVSL